MKHKCPVCGYRDLVKPPENHAICPSCGTEFGYDDTMKTHVDLRKTWIVNGAPWFSDKTTKPKEWSPIVQLALAGLLPIRITGNSLSLSEKSTILGEQPDYRYTFAALCSIL